MVFLIVLVKLKFKIAYSYVLAAVYFHSFLYSLAVVNIPAYLFIYLFSKYAVMPDVDA